MTKQKPETPYARLLRECRQWAFTVEYPKRRTMFVFPKSKLREGWTLGDVAERVQAAKAYDEGYGRAQHDAEAGGWTTTNPYRGRPKL